MGYKKPPPAHNPTAPGGWDPEYNKKFGHVLCSCGHGLSLHRHTGTRVPCRIDSCSCEWFSGPLENVPQRTQPESEG